MTPQERAEKIVEEFMYRELYPEENPLIKIRDFIAAEIQAAVSEAKKGCECINGHGIDHCCCQVCAIESMGKAKIEAYEEAAKIAELHAIEWESGVAAIRAKAKEVQ